MQLQRALIRICLQANKYVYWVNDWMFNITFETIYVIDDIGI